MTVREDPFVDLRLDVHALDAGGLLQARDVDLVVEVADVADDRVVLHLRHVGGGDDVLVARRRDEHVGGGDDVVERLDVVALHRGLQRADRVDLGDDDAAALGAQRGGRALADVAVAADDADLAGEHDVGRAEDAVDERVAAAVEVVELRLRHRVVDVDRREQERPLLGHLVEAPDARRRLLGHADDLSGHLREALAVLGERLVQQREEVDELLGLAGRGVRRRAGGLVLDALVDEHRGVAAVVEDEVRAVAVRPHAAPARCTTSTRRASRPSRRRSARPWGRRRCRRGRRPPRPRRGPASRRCCSCTSGPRRRAP